MSGGSAARLLVGAPPGRGSRTRGRLRRPAGRPDHPREDRAPLSVASPRSASRRQVAATWIRGSKAGDPNPAPVRLTRPNPFPTLVSRPAGKEELDGVRDA